MNNAAIGIYMRHLAGESIEEIAASDDVSPKTVSRYVTEGAAFANQQTALKVQNLRDQGALQNEQLRINLRNKHHDRVEEVIGILLQGIQTAVETDKQTGEVTLREYVSPDVLLAAVNLYRKMVSLEEKPVANTVIQTNIQQNNNNSQTHVAAGGSILDFETEIAKLKQKQKDAHQGRVFDVKTELPEGTNF